MKEYLKTERLEPTKRLVVERVRDFSEIYEVFVNTVVCLVVLFPV